MSTLTESVAKDVALAWPEGLGHTILHSHDIAPGEPFAESDDYGHQVALERQPRVPDEECFLAEVPS